jgi:predicted Zn finger-like uncharacterized protein
MIIECPTCNTKFNIDDNKIKGKTVKLKCSKCGHMFTPSTEPPPPPENSLENFVSKAEPPPEEAPGQSEFPEETAGEGQPMDDELKSAIDEALKEFKLTESKDIGASSEPDFGEAVKPESEILGDANFSVREEPPEKTDEFVSSGFELKSEEILGTLKPETPQLEGFESTKIGGGEQDLIGDLELELGGKGSEAKAEGESLPEVKEDDFGLEAPSRTTTPVPSAPAFPKTPTPTEARAVPVTKRVPISTERTPSRSVLPYIFFFLIVVASGVLGFKFRNEVLSIFNKNSSEQNITKAFTVVSSRYNFMQNIRGQTLFIVEGRAKNVSTKVQNFLKLKVTLKDNEGKDVATKEFFAGNVVSDESLRTDPAPDVESRFDNRVGDALANMNIKPQDEVQFMVVFYDIPNVSSFSIEIISSEEIH